MDEIEFYDDINSYLLNNLDLDIDVDDDMVEYVAAHLNKDKTVCKLAIIALFKEIMKQMLQGNTLSIVDFGRFYIKNNKIYFKPIVYLKKKII